MIEFSIWSPDEATFWQSWIDAGICSAPREFTAAYPGISISDQTSQGWTPTRATGQIVDGVPVMAQVPGWHANVRITHPAMVAQFTAGLTQVDADGNLLPLFERTHAASVFGLVEQPADPVTGFPHGYRNTTGVTYCDPRDISSPSNEWA